jgi:hypothetical protein
MVGSLAVFLCRRSSSAGDFDASPDFAGLDIR